MTRFSAIVKSLRLRTLPLSLAGVMLGILLAVADFQVRGVVALFIVLTTVCLQIISNLSNELGDVLNGTDTGERQGPQYGLDAGVLTVKEMKRLIGLFVCLCIVFGLLMIWTSYGTLLSLDAICLIMLGAVAIGAAMKYTLGRNPYGYRGLGDLFVFIFFGLVAVLGSYLVAAHTIDNWFLLFPAAAIGCFSMAVLNVNNIRDMKTDAPNRVTVAMKLGPNGARIYQTVLIVLGWIFMILYCQFRIYDVWHYLFVLTLPLFIKHLAGVWKKKDSELDPMLPLLVIASFLFAILAGLGFVWYLL